MLAFLLDEQISHVVMEQLRQKRPEIRIESVLRWQDAELRGKSDEMVLRAAQEDKLTLVTYDLKTILPLALQWATEERDHAGIVLIDDRSIAQEDVGGKVLALLSLWEREKERDWTNIIAYLKPE